MKKIFVSHPYTENPAKNMRHVDMVCKEIMEKNKDILLISPLHLWSFLGEDGHYRDDILKFCKYLVEGCDEIYIYIPYNSVDVMDSMSSGQWFEYRVARDLDIPITFQVIKEEEY